MAGDLICVGWKQRNDSSDDALLPKSFGGYWIPRLVVLRIPQGGRAPGPRVVTGAGSFDLDHIGTQIR